MGRPHVKTKVICVLSRFHIIIVIITIIINSWFSAPPTTWTMTHYTVQFKSAIPELVAYRQSGTRTFSRNAWKPAWNPSAWVLLAAGSMLGGGRQQKTPSRRISDGSWERRSRRLTRACVCWCYSRGSDGSCPLHMACTHGSHQCLRVLLDVLTVDDIAAVDDFARSALHAAALAGCVHVHCHMSAFLIIIIK